ncbi:unnamed protein product, partial [Effrenium voratum]
EAQMVVLRDGLRKLGLAESLPLTEACKRHTSLEAVVDDSWEADVFVWPGKEGEGSWYHRKEIKGGTLRQRLVIAAREGPPYLAEVSRGAKTPHHLTGEASRTLTTRDVRDCGFATFSDGPDSRSELPMWDRGHAFVGARGVGSCLHVDQAWWSNVAKNFTGYKLVALWGKSAGLEGLMGQLFRRPLSAAQVQALREATTIALLGPGDVASFSGGLPHATVVVGEGLNLTAYESLVNWHPGNAGLLLHGALRKPGSPGVMKRSALNGLLDDIVDVARRAEVGGHPLPAKGRVVILQLGSTNDDRGAVDGEVKQRAKRVAALWRQLDGSKEVLVLASGGSDPDRFFNRTATPHWRYVQQELLALQVPEEVMLPGLPALHTVDEALMAREVLKPLLPLQLAVVTSEFHAERAGHLFRLACDEPGLEVSVLPVPNACTGSTLQWYLDKEASTLRALKAEPFGTWRDFLQEHQLMDRRPQACLISSAAAGHLRASFRETLMANRRCRRRMKDGAAFGFEQERKRKRKRWKRERCQAAAAGLSKGLDKRALETRAAPAPKLREFGDPKLIPGQ